MRLLIIIIFLSVFTGCKVKKNNTTNLNHSCWYFYDSIVKMNIYTVVTEPPSYEGGMAALSSFIFKNLEVKKNEYMQASFKVVIYIDKDGKIIYQNIQNKKGNLTAQEAEILRVVKMLTLWTPAKCENTNVPFKLVIPIYW